MSRSWLIVPLLLLYLWQLGAVGFLGPDEPRYASVGREMARSGDWVTPRLDGQPWFEKPPLLYWTTAAAHRIASRIHLSDEWAARLPVVLVSVLFLWFFYTTLAREFSERVATAATLILATSAGWVAYSFAALTDLLMSAALGAAMLIAVSDTRPKRGWLAGALMGVSILAKGFVPVVLYAPLIVVTRGRVTSGKRLATVAGAVIVAAPWFVLCYVRNGSAFWNDFFWKQHIERVYSPTLEHVQPFWYYVPVLLAGLFPWTPLAGLLARRKIYGDVRVRLLAAWVVYGLVFFSASSNKLPGYLLPLMPALAVVLAIALDTCPRVEWWVAACAALLVALPTVARVLPAALLSGIRKTDLSFAPTGLLLVPAAGAVWWLAYKGKAELAVAATALAAGLGIVYLKNSTFPALEQSVSVRGFWRANRDALTGACLDNMSRTWQYGLNYYAGSAVPQCGPAQAGRNRIGIRDGRLVVGIEK
ncbi:MAG TPA: glycosyltransferase family 39 protein [Bryobacteraceae bacterium]|nr:glycosyltransferase family 39 protein [Bryobacteraceae bacterium]